MASSQNGWKANDRTAIVSMQVPGTTRRIAVRVGPPGEALVEFAAAFHRTVERIDDGIFDDWGYAERAIRGSSTTLSNHASGTAIDLNATRHPLGRVGTFSPAQAAQIRRLIAATGGVLRWGGDYIGRKDEMHVEVNDGRDVNDCARARDALRRYNGAPTPGPAPAPAPPPPPPPPPPRPQPRQEDTEMYWETPAPDPNTPPSEWPRIRRVYAFDPSGGWSGQGRLRLNAGPQGCFVRLARWWMRNDDWTPNNRDRMHFWDHPGLSADEDGLLFPVAGDWQVDLPPRATSIELEFAAPTGVHVISVYNPPR